MTDEMNAAPVGWCRGEEEIVLAVAADAVGSPHGVGVGSHPWHFVLTDDHAMVGPVGQVLRGEHVVVLHAEPVLSLAFRRQDVVRGIEIHFAVEHAGSRVGGELVADDWVLRRHDGGQPQKE